MGLLFLLEVIVWSLVLKWGVDSIGSSWPARRWRPITKVGIFILLLPLPLVDEIVGGWQFKRLCETNVVHVDRGTARGRTVYAESGAVQIRVPGTWVPVWKLSTRYLDVATNEVVVSFDHLWAEGGHLFPGFDSGHDPLTFKGTCTPSGVPDRNFYAELGLKIVERPQTK